MVFDHHAVLLILAIAVVGGLIGLDRTAAGQFMISQPIVAGPLAGWLLGNLDAGILIGGILELIWVLDMPVGTFVPADATVGTVSATAIAVLGSGRGPLQPDLLGFSILLSAGMAPITTIVDEFVRKRNARLADMARSGTVQNARCVLSRAHLSGLVAFFLKSFVLYLFFVPAGLAAVAFFRSLPDQVHSAMTLFLKAVPLLGAALILHKLSIAVLDRFLVTGFAAAAVLTVLLGAHPLVIVLVTTLAGFAGARYAVREREPER